MRFVAEYSSSISWVRLVEFLSICVHDIPSKKIDSLLNTTLALTLSCKP